MRNLSFILILVIFSGCAYRLKTLSVLSNNRKLMAEEMDLRGDNFNKLVIDIDTGALKEGLSKQDITALYGSALLTGLKRDGCDNVWLYQDQSQKLNGPKAYLYFDQENKLSAWKRSDAGS